MLRTKVLCAAASLSLAAGGHAIATCPWDCVGDDGEIGIEEFLAVLGTWGEVGVPCDVDGGGVGITDFLMVLGLWGACPCPPLDVQVAATVPLPADFISQVVNSPLTASYELTFAAQGWSLSFANAIEVFATGLPPAADGARFALIPLVDGNGFGVALFGYTFAINGIEGADVVQVFDEEPNNRISFSLDPEFRSRIDLLVDDEGCLVAADGECNLPTCGYWDCVLAQALILAGAGNATGISQVCITACIAGGLANPGCDACLADAITAVVAIRWVCL